MDNRTDRELDWNDIIENDNPEYMTLPEGDYDFEITDFERGRHGGSDKLPPCNKAIIGIKIYSTEGNAFIKHNLFLHTKTEGILCAFFAAIGQRQKGEKVKMNWGAIVGATGRAKVNIRKWTDKEGNERLSNEISRFYEKEIKGFEAGKF